MKRLLFFFLTMYHLSYGQITLDETYPNAGYYGAASSWQVFEVVRLEVDGDKFLFRDNANRTLKFYNLDHSLWKSISYENAIDMNPNYNTANILYVSQHLFDLDDEIEFMYIDENGSAGSVTQVVNEDESVLFTATNQWPRLNASVPQNQQPIYTTDEGTFMILSGGSTADGNAYVYRLPGSLAVGVEENVFTQFTQGSLKTYPNPSANEVMVEYSVPFGSYGTLRFTDELGRVVQTVQLPTNEGTYTLDAGTLGTGVYFCTLLSGAEVVATQKLVVSTSFK